MSQSLIDSWPTHARLRLVTKGERVDSTGLEETRERRDQAVMGDVGALATPGWRDLFITLVTPC